MPPVPPGRAGHGAPAERRRRAAALASGEDIGLSPAGAQAVAVALRRMEDLEAELAPVRAQIGLFARRQPACKALQQQLFAVPGPWWPRWCGRSWAMPAGSPPPPRPSGIPAWMSRCTPPTASAPPGHLYHQGLPILRWALSGAGQLGSRTTSPGHRYYADVAARIDANRAALPVARKLARRSHHILRRLGDQAYAPVPAGR
jgi:transposase